MPQEKVISALVGLVGACNNNPKTENTDMLILNALSASTDSEKWVDAIHAEKFLISPGCATCATPCGNTSDYDMDRIHSAPSEVRNLKQKIMVEICKLATCISQNSVAKTDENMPLFYKTLSYVGYDVSEQTLLALLEEIQTAKSISQGVICND